MVFDFGSGIGRSAGGGAADMGGRGLARQAGDFLGGQFGNVAGQVGGRMVGGALGAINEAIFGRKDPELAFQYALEIDGITSVAFKECKGLEWECEVRSFHEGGNNMHEQHLIGPARFKPLEIKRGFIGSNDEFHAWMRRCVDPTSKAPIDRVTISLVIFNDEMMEVGRFNFYEGFISKWSGPSFDAGSNEIAFESMTIHYDFFDFVPGGSLAQKLKEKLGGLF